MLFNTVIAFSIVIRFGIIITSYDTITLYLGFWVGLRLFGKPG